MMRQDPNYEGEGTPAIWLYPEQQLDVEISLEFKGGGFMTSSLPAYNDKWRIHVDPTLPFTRYSSTYIDDPWRAYLDYDGFRDGEFQREHGWCIPQKELIQWQRSTLREYGFTDGEIDDANTTYARMLLERRHPEPYFAIYPQDKEQVDKSVALTVVPAPQSTQRLWLYFVPSETMLDLKAPRVVRTPRNGFTVVELAYLTDREIPGRPNVPEAIARKRGMLRSVCGR